MAEIYRLSEDGKVFVRLLDSSLKEFTIPEGVEKIGPEAFSGCHNLQNIVIPSGVTEIGEHAFEYCSSLKIIVVDPKNSVYDSRNNCNAIIETANNMLILGCSTTAIPDGVTSIGDSAFRGCSGLQSIDIPSGVTEIGICAFCDCSSLTKIEIPNSVTSIGSTAFGNCESLQTIIIPESVIEIGDSAFDCCYSLDNIVIPDSVNKIYSDAFYCCSSLSSIVFPKGVKFWGRKDDDSDYEEDCLGRCAFAGCSSLTSIEIPQGVITIGNGAFEHCSSLTSIVIPEGVTYIGEEAFSGCSSLTSIVMPEGVTDICDYAFEECRSLTSIVIPEGVTYIGGEAFSGCSSLTSIVMPEGVEEIGHGAFSGCSSLISIVIPEGVEEIGNGAFSGCSSLTSIVIPEGVSSIGDRAFDGCSSLPVGNGIRYADTYLVEAVDKSQSNYTIKEGTRWIGPYAFEDCSSLISIVIPEGVEEIGYGAFSGCSSLTSIVIPEGVSSIRCRAFEGCTSLSSIQIPDSIEYIGDDALKDISIKSIEISYDGIRSLLGYGEEDYEAWTDFLCSPNFSKKLIYDLGSPRLDGMNYFLTDHGTLFIRYFGVEPIFTIPDGVKEINIYAFFESNLETVIFPKGVTSIGCFAFAFCQNLHTVILPEGLVSIRWMAFAGCSSLIKMVIPKSVEEIDVDAFEGCDNFDPNPYSLVFTYKSKGKDLEVRTELYKGEINNDIDLSGALKGKQLIKDNDGEVLMSIYDRYDHYITKDLLLDKNLDIIANEDCSHTLYFEDVEVGFYMICGIDDEALGAELENCIKQDDSGKFTDLFNPYDCDFHEVSAGYSCGWDDKIQYSIYDENGKPIKRGSKKVHEDNIFKYTLNYPGDDCFKEINTKYIVMCYDAYEIGMVPFPVPKDFNINYMHFNDGRAFNNNDDRIDLTQIHYKGKVYEAVMDDIGDNGTYGAREYELYKKDENGRYEWLGSIR